LHTVVLEVNGSYIDDNSLYSGNSALSRDNNLTSKSDFTNQTNRLGDLINSTFIFRKKFQRKGRRMGFNASYLRTSLEDNWQQDSYTAFLDDSGNTESDLTLDQSNENLATKVLFKANALYVEPLSKKFFLQTFYNYRDRKEDGERTVNDVTSDQEILNDDLSRSYNNTIDYHRGGSAIRYSNDGLNVSVGGAYQYFGLGGEYKAISDQRILGTVDRNFGNFIPHFSVSYTPKRNTRLSFSYNRVAKEPSIQDLAPLVDNINPLFIRIGNSALEPELQNSIRFRASRNFPLHDLRISMSGSVSLYDSQFSSRETVDDNLVTTYQPINVNDGQSRSVWFNFSIPIIKNKIKFRTWYSIRHNFRTSLVNDIENQTKVLTHSPTISIDITPSKDYSLYLSTDWSISNTTYDINTSQDQQVRRVDYEIEANAKLVAGFFLSANLNYSRYTNDRFNQDRVIPILNASIYRHFMPKNQLEVRFSLYDGFNENVGFNQSAYGIGVSQSTVESLARYGLVSLTYNIRGMKTDVRKDSWW